MTVRDASLRGRLRAPIGVIDRPAEQARELLTADLSGAAGHVAVVGGPKTGKSSLLRTLVLALAMTHTPEEIQFYCLDFGGGAIASIGGLPHVGSVATRLERDRVVRTIEEVSQVMERREQLFAEQGVDSMDSFRAARRDGRVEDPFGDVFLVVDGWFSLRNDYVELEQKIAELAARGLTFGVHVVIASTRWSEIRPHLRDLLQTRFELRLGDPMESEVGSRKARTVPGTPGRGLTPDGLHFLAALPRMDGSSAADDLATAARAAADEVHTFWPGRRALPVRLLPTNLPMSGLPLPDGDLRIALGQDERRLSPVAHDFRATPHLLAFGDSETGKTNLLRLVLRGVLTRYRPEDAKIVLADPSRQLGADVPEAYRVGYATTAETLRELAGQASVSLAVRVPDQSVTVDQLKRRDWWSGPRLFLVVDDYELLTTGLDSPLEPLLSLLSQGAYIGLHLVVARSTSGAAQALVDPVIRRVWELGCPGLVFAYPKEEGRFLGEATPRALPPGRAQLVTRRGVTLIQTGLVPTGVGEQPRQAAGRPR